MRRSDRVSTNIRPSSGCGSTGPWIVSMTISQPRQRSREISTLSKWIEQPGAAFGLAPMRSVMMPLALPLVLELAQLFVQSHAASLRDMAMGFIGSGLGLCCGLWWPSMIRPCSGLGLLTVGLIAAGLSPYQFVPWELRSDFEWVPCG